MATLRFVLWTYRERKDGTSPLMLRITRKRKSKYLSTKIYIEPRHWNDNRQRISKSHPEANYLNDYLNQLISDTRKKVLHIGEDEELTIHAGGKDFVSYADGLIDSIKSRGQYWNWKNIRTALNKFIDFMGTDNISFNKINGRVIREFEGYLIKSGNKKNTRHKNLQSLQRIFRSAVRERVISPDDNPFIGIRLSKERVEKQKLTLEEVRKLIAVDVPIYSGQWHAKNYWLFSFFCAGLRFSDLSRLRWQHVQDGRISYKMSKTGIGKNIAMVPQAISILNLYRSPGKNLNDYVFPLLKKEYTDENKMKAAISSRNALVNKDLKQVAEKAEIKTPISMHIARHTFATLALAGGMDIYTLSKSLGHADLKITQNYLKSFDEKVDTEISRVFGEVFK